MKKGRGSPREVNGAFFIPFREVALLLRGTIKGFSFSAHGEFAFRAGQMLSSDRS